MYYPEDSKEGKEVSMDEDLNFNGSLVGNGVDWEMHLAHVRDRLSDMMLGRRPSKIRSLCDINYLIE